MSTEQLLENFEFLEDWEDRYRYIIDLGKGLPPFPEEYRTPEYKVTGCQSQVWIVPNESENGKLEFAADSDALIVKGLIAILLEIYQGKSPKEILDTDSAAILQEIGLDSHLSPTRKNGLFSMIDRIKKTAQARLN